MKSLILTIALGLAALVSSAQWSNDFMSNRKHFLYSSGECVVGESMGGKLALSYIYKNSLIINVGYTATQKSQGAIPTDYLKSGQSMPVADKEGLFENTENIHLMIGKVVNINKDKTIRLLLQAGPGLSTFRKPEFTPREAGDASATNYNYNIQTKNKISLVINPRIEFPMCCMIGFSVGPMMMINNEQNYFGAGVGIMYGIVGKKKS